VQSSVVDLGWQSGVRGLAVDLPLGAILELQSDEGKIPFTCGWPNASNLVRDVSPIAWWRSDLGVVLNGALTRVSAWNDQIGGYRLVGNTPFTSTNPVLGGFPSIDGDIASQAILEENPSRLAALLSGNDRPWSTWTVVRTGPGIPVSTYAALLGDGGNHTIGIAAGSLWNTTRAGVPLSAGALAPATNFLIRINYAGPTCQITFNGSDATFGQQPFDTAPLTFNRYSVLAERASVGAPVNMFTGSIVEHVIYEFQPSAADISRLVPYFQARYPGVA
jgi:hypothetical protein